MVSHKIRLFKKMFKCVLFKTIYFVLLFKTFYILYLFIDLDFDTSATQPNENSWRYTDLKMESRFQERQILAFFFGGGGVINF